MTNSPKSGFVQAAQSFAKRAATVLAAGAATACTVVPAYPGVTVAPGYVRVATPRVVVSAPVYVPAPVFVEPAVVVPYGEVVVIGGFAGPCHSYGGCYGHRPAQIHYRR